MGKLEVAVRPLKQDASLKAKSYEALREVITGMNIYDDDAKLRLDERSLSEQFGISRTPLREALARLEQEGLVKIEPRRGVYVVRKTKAEILDMICVWAALESMAARRATKLASDEDLHGLQDLVYAFDDDDLTSHMGEYSDANIKFHQAIIALGGCDLIRSITDGLFMHVRAIRQRTIFEKDRVQRSVVDHKEIVAALEARDTERAERLVRDHTLKLKDHVERYVDLD